LVVVGSTYAHDDHNGGECDHPEDGEYGDRIGD
jgi:hypothetical protein